MGELKELFERLYAGVPARRESFGYKERCAALKSLHAALGAHEREIIKALADDFGKPEAEVLLTEILPVKQEITHALKRLKRWMADSRLGPTLATLGTKARIRKEPRGLCLIIAPWNYPVNLALGPLVSCIAAGNAAVVKPSEITPAASAVVAKIIRTAFAPDLVAVVEGGVEASTALLALPFDHIFFTGSPEVGKVVMRAAAEHLTSVTLELGGKSPVVIGPGANLANAAEWITFGKFTNAGQTCIAPDYIFVHESVRETFLKLLRARLTKAYGTGESSPHLARIVSARHAARLRGHLQDAREKGAAITGGGGEGTTLQPALLESVTPEMTVMQEEIFGPLLPVVSYTDLTEVLARINASPKPLALYVFEASRDVIDRVVAGTSSGGVGVNLTVLHYSHEGLPFGGVNHSGHGASHGEWGFLAFSHQRAILENRFSPLPMIFAPYGKRALGMIRMAARLLGGRG